MAQREDGQGGSGVSSGVEELIRRLTEEGVAEGRAQAQRLVEEADRRAAWIVQQAREEAETLVSEAREEAERLRRAGDEALQVAARDAILDLKDTLSREFTRQLEAVVAGELARDDFLQRLILEVAGRARDEAGVDADTQVEILLPRDLVGVEDLRRKPEELRKGTLSYFVAAMAGDLLRKGVVFAVSQEPDHGIRVRLGEGGVEIDLTDQAVARMLLDHLLPRFRALLEGIVKG